MGVAGVDKGREGWGKGREDWGEKVADSLSFLFLFSLPAPSPSLHLPLRLLWLLWTRYTLGFSKATVCLVSRKTLPAYHITNIFCPNTKIFFILIGYYTSVNIQFITQITKLLASWVFLWPELKVDKKASVSFSLD